MKSTQKRFIFFNKYGKISKVREISAQRFIRKIKINNRYIPDNFILGKEEVSFLFNRYDIAPYSAGEIVLHISYEKIGPFMKI